MNGIGLGQATPKTILQSAEVSFVFDLTATVAGWVAGSYAKGFWRIPWYAVGIVGGLRVLSRFTDDPAFLAIAGLTGAVGAFILGDYMSLKEKKPAYRPAAAT